MDGSRGVLESQPYVTFLPNGPANTRDLAWPDKIRGFKAGHAGTRIFAARDQTQIPAGLACQRANIKNRASNTPRQRGLFSQSLCGQRFGELRGGARSRDRTCLSSPNSLICGNLQGIFAICREFGSGRRWKDTQDQPVTAKIPYATDQGIFRSRSGILTMSSEFAGAGKPPTCPALCRLSSRDRTLCRFDQGLRQDAKLTSNREKK
jgi:hypothetical protein